MIENVLNERGEEVPLRIACSSGCGGTMLLRSEDHRRIRDGNAEFKLKAPILKFEYKCRACGIFEETDIQSIEFI